MACTSDAHLMHTRCGGGGLTLGFGAGLQGGFPQHLGDLFQLGQQGFRPCSVAVFQRIGQGGVKVDDLFARAGGVGDHVHQRLHGFNRAGQLVGQHRVAGAIDQRPVKGHVRGAEAFV